MVLADEVNVPRFAIIPMAMEMFPLTVMAIPKVFVPELENVRLLKVVELVPPMDWVVPLKFIVLPVEVKVPPLFVQLPPTLCVNAPVVKPVPLPRITPPPIVIAVAAVAVAVPLKVRLPLTAETPVIVLVPLPESVRLLYVTAAKV